MAHDRCFDSRTFNESKIKVQMSVEAVRKWSPHAVPPWCRVVNPLHFLPHLFKSNPPCWANTQGLGISSEAVRPGPPPPPEFPPRPVSLTDMGTYPPPPHAMPPHRTPPFVQTAGQKTSVAAATFTFIAHMVAGQYLVPRAPLVSPGAARRSPRCTISSSGIWSQTVPGGPNAPSPPPRSPLTCLLSFDNIV